MKTRNLMIGLGVVAALAAGIGAYSYTASAQGGPGYGPGMMGGGFGPGMMMSGNGPGMTQDFGPGGGQGYGPGYHRRGWGGGPGPGMMRQGYGPGYGPRGDAQSNQAVNLSADDVKARMERWLAWRQNSRLKVGDVKEKDADTISADIVTKDNSLVERFIVDRHTGLFRRDNS
jgi:hypothetical protein